MSGIEFKQFLAKKSRPLIVRPDRSANQRPVFFWETTCTHALTLLSEKTDFRWFHLMYLLEQKLTYLFLMNYKQKRCILGPKLKYFFMTSKCSTSFTHDTSMLKTSKSSAWPLVKLVISWKNARFDLDFILGIPM